MIGLSTAAATALADQITTLVDAGAAAGTIAVYDGDRPDTPDDAGTGTLLATFTLNDPSAAAAVAGVLTWDYTTTPATATVAASGTPSWFRVADSDGNAVFDGDVATDGADANADSVVWVAGETVDFNGGSVTQQVG